MATDSFVGVSDEVRQYLNNNYSTTPVEYPNDINFEPPNNSAWVRMNLGGEATTAIDVAESPTFRHEGALILQIFTPLETGERENREIGDELAGLFRYHTLDTTLFRAPDYDPIGRIDIDEGAWWQGTLTTPYRRDTQFSV